mmetsp:Transcript_90087/g.241567  ORF Transcript_90087/g.241567 Transcript_90087/m.241567 type:complete len:241 (+) Transcript_90087:391-1113(+)
MHTGITAGPDWSRLRCMIRVRMRPVGWPRVAFGGGLCSGLADLQHGRRCLGLSGGRLLKVRRNFQPSLEKDSKHLSPGLVQLPLKHKKMLRLGRATQPQATRDELISRHVLHLISIQHVEIGIKLRLGNQHTQPSKPIHAVLQIRPLQNGVESRPVDQSVLVFVQLVKNLRYEQNERVSISLEFSRIVLVLICPLLFARGVDHVFGQHSCNQIDHGPGRTNDEKAKIQFPQKMLVMDCDS